MGERITSSNKCLFEVRLLHHYWLDDGGTLFDDLPSQAAKDARLQSYDRRRFLGVRPTPSTERLLAGKRCLFKETALGFIVTAPVDAQIPEDTVLEFVVTVKDARFYDYTALTLQSQTIHEFFNTADETAYRYKENVPVLSNLTGVARGSGASRELFLSQQNRVKKSDDPVEAIVQSGAKLLQLTGEGSSAATQQLTASAKNWPVFLHQGDVPEIEPPSGLTGTPANGIRLSAEVSDDVHALIELAAVRPGKSYFSYIDASGNPKSPPPVYQVRFKNRSTFWRYLDKATGIEITTEAEALPLTYFGNAGTKQKPSGGLVKPEKSGTKITRLISEVYV